MSRSRTARPTSGCAALLLLLAQPLQAAPPPPAPLLPTINRIIDAEMYHGEVDSLAEHLSDHIGGRITNSPAFRASQAWAVSQLRAWGLSNVHREGFEFGRGWWIESSLVRMTAPRTQQLKSIPIAWTPPTTGAVEADLVLAPLQGEEDFARWSGKLRGKIVLVSAPRQPVDDVSAPFHRFTDDDISGMDTVKPAIAEPAARESARRKILFVKRLDRYLAEEGAVAWVRMSDRDNGLVEGAVVNESYKIGDTPRLPATEIAAEDYRRLARLLKSGPVRLQIDNRVHYDDTDPQAYNILADIPGRDPGASYVMAGAHLDSWVGGDGATDNGAGVAVIMEAARLLSSLGVRPKRTIRFALWAGEEQGALGSYWYVEQHLAHRPRPSDPVTAALVPWWWIDDAYPIEPLSGYGALAGYFNIDNGSGRIRGIYAQNNVAAVPTLRQWLAPFTGLQANSVVMKVNGGSDHVFMVKAGLPAFSFIQDPLDYESHVHHSEIDTYDHLRPDDLRQAAIIVAAILLQAADSDQPLPPLPLPTRSRDIR